MEDSNSSESTEEQTTLTDIAENVRQAKGDEESDDTEQTEGDEVDANKSYEQDAEYPERITIEISTQPWLERLDVDIDELESLCADTDESESTESEAISEQEKLPQSIKDLPRRLSKSDLPDEPPTGLSSSRPTECDYCGSTGNVWEKPLEKGSIEDSPPTPCSTDEIGSCDCCGCPECEVKSIYYRKTMNPSYRCHSSECRAEFSRDEITLLDEDEDEWEFLFWECQYCSKPTLAPFDGIPEWYLQAAKAQSDPA